MSPIAYPINPSQSLLAAARDNIPSEATAILGMIERAARDPAVDIDKMERLLERRERILAREAETAFDTAMAEAQTEMRPVAQDSDNSQTRSKYASYVALDAAVRPIYVKHGFSLSFSTAEGAPDLHVRVTCRVARGGAHRNYHLDMPADGKGAKGGDVMTRTHATGSAITYGRRYLLSMIFNVAVGERDDDGNAAGGNGAVISAEQLETIQSLIVETGSDIGKFCKYMKVAELPAIPAARFQAAVDALNAKKGKGQDK